MSNKIFTLIDHKRKGLENIREEIEKWLSAYTKDEGNIVSFGAILVEKDGTVTTYHDSLSPLSRLSLLGGIEVIKEVIFRSEFDFD